MFVIYFAVVYFYEAILLKEQLTIHGHDLKFLFWIVVLFWIVEQRVALCIFFYVYVGEFCWIVL